MIHKTEIEGFAIQELADKIGDLRYDTLNEFLIKLATKIKKDAFKDRNRGRTKLANQLDNAAKNIELSADNIDKAWVICEPFV
jgi:uncharacterized Fe-S cluster-containing protein